jgi:hypothetical protein
LAAAGLSVALSVWHSSYLGLKSMARVQPPFGFPADSEYRFRLSGRSLRVGPSGVRTLKLLTEIYNSCRTRTDGKWPYRLRDHFKRVKAIDSRSVLTLVVDRTHNRTLRILAIWLRGRCGGSFGTSVLFRFSADSDTQTRKEVARSLKRMEAWAQLRAIAADDPNPRVRQMATCRMAKPYEVRLGNVSKNVSRLEVPIGKQELVVSPDLDIRDGRPPKSTSFIRMILERIHRLVGGRSR